MPCIPGVIDHIWYPITKLLTNFRKEKENTNEWFLSPVEVLKREVTRQFCLINFITELFLYSRNVPWDEGETIPPVCQFSLDPWFWTRYESTFAIWHSTPHINKVKIEQNPKFQSWIFVTRDIITCNYSQKLWFESSHLNVLSLDFKPDSTIITELWLCWE